MKRKNVSVYNNKNNYDQAQDDQLKVITVSADSFESHLYQAKPITKEDISAKTIKAIRQEMDDLIELAQFSQGYEVKPYSNKKNRRHLQEPLTICKYLRMRSSPLIKKLGDNPTITTYQDYFIGKPHFNKGKPELKLAYIKPANKASHLD
jgi:hypothetical protein